MATVGTVRSTSVQIQWDAVTPAPVGYYVTAYKSGTRTALRNTKTYATPAADTYSPSLDGAADNIRVTLSGAGGGGPYGNGSGALITGILTRSTYSLVVGGSGLNSTGLNGGGGGGGYSVLKSSENDIVALAGGGGGGTTDQFVTAGNGGFLGGAGSNPINGQGGTQSSAGAGGYAVSYTDGAPGTGSTGGSSSTFFNNGGYNGGGNGGGGIYDSANCGGGGGGGYYGGGAGSYAGGAGGGGSSFVPAGFVCADGGGGIGNGMVSIQELVNPTETAYICRGLEPETEYSFFVYADYGNTIPDPTNSPVVGTSNIQQVGTLTRSTISVGAPNASTDTATGPEDATITGNVLTNDNDDNDYSLTVSGFAVDGQTGSAGDTITLTDIGSLIIGADGSYTFTPVANWNGEVPVIAYTITNGSFTSSSTLTLTVTAVSDAPVAVADTATGPEDTPITGNVLTNDTDVDSSLTVSGFTVDGQTGSAGDTITLTDIGSLIIGADGSYTFTPVANWNGAVPVITYTATDGSLTSSSTLTLTVTAVNDAPVAVADTATGPEDTPITGNVLTNDTDVDSSLTVSGFTVDGQTGSAGDTITVTDIGSLIISADGSYTFTPVSSGNGAVPVITYTATDGNLTSTSTLTLSTSISSLNQSLAGKHTNYAHFVISVTVKEGVSDVIAAEDETAVFVYSKLQTLEVTLAATHDANPTFGAANIVHIDKGLTGETFLEGTAYISGGLFLSSPPEDFSSGTVEVTETSTDDISRSNFIVNESFDVVLNSTAGNRSGDSMLTVTITDSAGSQKSKTYTVKWTVAPAIFNPAYVYIAESNPNSDASIVKNSSTSEDYKYRFPVTFDTAYIVVSEANPLVTASTFAAGSSPSFSYGVTGGYLEVTLSQAQSVSSSWDDLTVTLRTTRTSNEGELVLSDAGLLLTGAGILEDPVFATLHIKVADRPYTFQDDTGSSVKDDLMADDTHLTNFIPNDLSTDTLSGNIFYDYAPSTSSNAGVIFTPTEGDSLRTYETMVFRDQGLTGGGVFGFSSINADDTYQIAIVTVSTTYWDTIPSNAATNAGFYHKTEGFVGSVLTVTSSGVSWPDSSISYSLQDIIAVCTDGPSDIGWGGTNSDAKLRLVVMQGITSIDENGVAIETSPIVVKSDVYSVWLSDASEVSSLAIDSAGTVDLGNLAFQFPDCLRLDFTSQGISFTNTTSADYTETSKRYVYSLQCKTSGAAVWYEIATNMIWSAGSGSSYTYSSYDSNGATVNDIKTALWGELPERSITEAEERDYSADATNCLQYRLLLQTQPRFNPNVADYNLKASNTYSVSSDINTKRVFYPASSIDTSDQYRDYRLPGSLPFYRQTVLDNGTFNPQTAYISKTVPVLACFNNALSITRTTLTSNSLENSFGLLSFTPAT